MKKKPTDIGKNRTGASASPVESRKTAEGAQEATPTMIADGGSLESERIAWSRDADPVGTVPPPASLKGAVKTATETVKGNQPGVLLDKLGERLAFERTGTRLYEALLVKLEAASAHVGEPTRAELERIRDDELRHMAVLREAMERLGADPTAMTPCADIIGVASMGLVQVLTDPRTTLTQGLEAILIAELADNDGWQMLADLADDMGQEELAVSFRQAFQEEEDHLVRVRTWLMNALRGQAGVAPTPRQPPAAAP